ncbi:hypothetical protein L3081_10020 [Colwellia sp. MSW7]|uniref:Uncharacterized protein n=1 Tax=Colwellia maritima TaxID=2912588 RepID=A0ABS9X1J5_9GAMM|nr:hypothetical protein [Colwellia maritima]MCI2283662.1 hypothetical protein [Colwellia maritima]
MVWVLSNSVVSLNFASPTTFSFLGNKEEQVLVWVLSNSVASLNFASPTAFYFKN